MKKLWEALKRRIAYALEPQRTIPRVAVHAGHFGVGAAAYMVGVLIARTLAFFGVAVHPEAWYWGIGANVGFTVGFESIDSFIKYGRPGRWLYNRDSGEDALQLVAGGLCLHFFLTSPTPLALWWLLAVIVVYIVRPVP